MCVIVVGAVYMGNLTASLAAQRIPWPFKDLEGLADDSEYKFLLRTGASKEEVILVEFHSVMFSQM